MVALGGVVFGGPMSHDITADILGIPPRDHAADQKRALENLKSRLNLQEVSLPERPAQIEDGQGSSTTSKISPDKLDRLLDHPLLGRIILRNMKFTG